jgi:hypothetical protein
MNTNDDDFEMRAYEAHLNQPEKLRKRHDKIQRMIDEHRRLEALPTCPHCGEKGGPLITNLAASRGDGRGFAVDTQAPSDPPDVREVAYDAVVSAMTRWFYTNFESPECNMPREDGEFVFVWGGPYDAREEINNAFGATANERTIEEAIKQIENVGTVWAPAITRVQPVTSTPGGSA